MTFVSWIFLQDIRVFYLDWQFISCTSDKDIRVFYLDRQFLSHPCYLTQDRTQITWIKCIGCIESHVSTSSSDVGFTADYEVTLCKLDINVKNRTAVIGRFFELK